MFRKRCWMSDIQRTDDHHVELPKHVWKHRTYKSVFLWCKPGNLQVVKGETGNPPLHQHGHPTLVGCFEKVLRNLVDSVLGGDHRSKDRAWGSMSFVKFAVVSKRVNSGIQIYFVRNLHLSIPTLLCSSMLYGCTLLRKNHWVIIFTTVFTFIIIIFIFPLHQCHAFSLPGHANGNQRSLLHFPWGDVKIASQYTKDWRQRCGQYQGHFAKRVRSRIG